MPAQSKRWLARVAASRGDPLHEALVQLGQLLRTGFLADYFVNDTFRRELLRVLNRAEAVNAFKRAIYTGRIAPTRTKGINLRGVFRFPVEAYADRLLPTSGQKAAAQGV